MNVIAFIKQHGLRKILRYIDKNYGFGKLEYLLATNWLNPFATIWVNFRSFPLKQALLLPFWVYGRPRFYGLSGSMKIKGHIRPGMIRFNHIQAGRPSLLSAQSELYNLGDIIFEGEAEIGCGTKIFLEMNSVMRMGKDILITDFINIGCFKSITIGERSQITQRCQVTDSNYHYIANFNNGTIPDCMAPIVIGKFCWIGNSSSIMGGSILPDYTIVASNSLVNKKCKDIPKNSIIGGTPAKLIATGFRRIRNSDVDTLVRKYYKTHKQPFVLDPSMTMEECSRIVK